MNIEKVEVLYKRENKFYFLDEKSLEMIEKEEVKDLIQSIRDSNIPLELLMMKLKNETKENILKEILPIIGPPFLTGYFLIKEGLISFEDILLPLINDK